MGETAMNNANCASATGLRPKAGLRAGLRRRLRSTPVRSFASYPVMVIACESVRQGGTLRVMPWGVPLADYCRRVKRRIPGIV